MKELSAKALEDLKIALRKSYGQDFGNDLTDEEFEHLGLFFLTVLAEGLKLKVEQSNKIKNEN